MAEDTTVPSPDHGTQSVRAKMPTRKLLFGLLLVSIIALISLAAVHQWRQYFSTLNVLARKARHGDAGAAFELGKSYERGLSGAPKDAQRAIQWYKQAADAGDMHAQNNLGVMYHRGEGIPKGYAVAFDWFRKAAEQGDSLAQWCLGSLYDLGRGVPQDYAEAYFWLNLAAAVKIVEVKQEDVAKERDESASHLSPADLSRVQERARKWFEDHPAKP